MLFAPNTVLPPQPITSTILLAPAYNALTTMSLIGTQEETADFSEWIDRTTSQIAPEIRTRQRLIFWGLGLGSLANAVELDPTTCEFSDYLAALAESDPVQLRDNIWRHLQRVSRNRIVADAQDAGLQPLPDDILDSKENYLDFFSTELKKLPIANRDALHAIYEQIYELLTDPPTLKNLLLTQLTYLWETFVATEWQRTRPLLQEVVTSLNQIEVEGLSVFDLLKVITKRDLRAILAEEKLLKFDHIQFIPSIHNGPYILLSDAKDTLRLTFSADIGQNSFSVNTHQFSQTKILNQFKALADENRIAILTSLRRKQEMNTQEIMNQLDLSKSAVSRHLRQLRANELILERRVEAGVRKFYRLNPTINEKMVADLAHLLGVSVYTTPQ